MKKEDIIEEIEKDFYDKLPSMVCELLDDKIIPEHGKEKWFGKAWEEYRQYILQTKDIMKMKMPGHIFKKYIFN